MLEPLSRAPRDNANDVDVSSFDVFRVDLEDQGQNPRLKCASVSAIRAATAAHPIFSDLVSVIVTGWPETRDQVTPRLKPYWTYREELSVIGGVVYKTHQCVIPSVMQSSMLSKLHASHAGAASNLRLAKEFMFWQGMASAIENICSSCGVCAQFPRSSPVEPMISVPIPEGPYELLSQDLFQFEGVSYLVTVCHWSDWIECDVLPDTLPKYMLSDNGPQFSHITASPYYPSGNGKAETAVKIAKNMLRKCEDFDLAMLLYRNTPQQGYVYSPAQRLLGHKTRTTLSVAQPSTHSSGADPKVIQQDLLHRRAKASLRP